MYWLAVDRTVLAACADAGHAEDLTSQTSSLASPGDVAIVSEEAIRDDPERWALSAWTMTPLFKVYGDFPPYTIQYFRSDACLQDELDRNTLGRCASQTTSCITEGTLQLRDWDDPQDLSTWTIPSKPSSDYDSSIYPYYLLARVADPTSADQWHLKYLKVNTEVSGTGGCSCDLSARGFNYPETVALWTSEGPLTGQHGEVISIDIPEIKVVPELTSGTHIASFFKDGVETELYAPSSSTSSEGMSLLGNVPGSTKITGDVEITNMPSSCISVWTGVVNGVPVLCCGSYYV